ncbi:hypothetical protein ACO0QE_003666 [Hanseniaspora vineae]
MRQPSKEKNPVTKVNRDLFYTLASDLDSERAQSVISIIDQLTSIQKHDNDTFIKEVNYTIDRLITGLGSNVGSARLGFSLCLTEIVNISLEDGITADAHQYIKKLQEKLPLNDSSNESKKKVKGKDERGFVFGRLFGLQVLMNEPLFSKLFVLDNGKEKTLNNGFLVEFASLLIDLSSFKSWIKETALFTLYQFLHRLEQTGLNDEQNVVQILGLLDSANITMTMEGLAIYLLFTANEKPYDLTLFKPKNLHWENNDPLNKTNMSLLVKVMKDVPVADSDSSGDVQLKQKGFWTPRLHFVFPILIETLLKTEDREEQDLEPPTKKQKKNDKSGKKHKKQVAAQKRFTIDDLYKNVVDESYFSEKSSNERKYIGFLIFKLCLETFPVEKVELLFKQQNFLRTLINHSSNKQRMLYKLCNSLLNKQIPAILQSQPKKITPILENIWFYKHNGSMINFDQLTKSKFTSSLLNHESLEEECLVALSEMLIHHLHKFLENIYLLKSKDLAGDEVANSEDYTKNLSMYKFCIDSLLHLVRSHKAQLSEKWILPIIKALAKISYFRDRKEKTLPATLNDREGTKDEAESAADQNDVHTIALERLYSILFDVLSSQSEISLKEKPVVWSLQLLEEITSIEEQLGAGFLLHSVDSSLAQIKDAALKHLQDIQQSLSFSKTTDGMKNVLQGLQQLLAINLLQLYSGNSEAIAILEDLSSFYADYAEKSSQDGVHGVVNFVSITEILMSSMSDNKAIFRKLSLNSWEMFVKEIGTQELEILLETLTTRENKSGFSQLFGGDAELEDGSDEDGEEEYDVDDDASEEEEVEEDDEDADTEFSDSDNDDNGKHTNEKNEKSSKIEKEAASALAKALDLPEGIVDENGDVNHDGYVDMGSDDGSGEEEEDEDLDDEKMLELDKTLSMIFKTRKEALSGTPTGNQRKIEVQKARENVINFKSRVVDMLEIYVKYIDKDASSDQKLENLLYMLPPMIQCIKMTLSKPLVDKLGKIIKTKITKIKVSAAHLDAQLIDVAVTTLQTVHKLALGSKSGQFSQLFYSVCSICSLFVSKIISLASENKSFDAVIEVYSDTMKEWSNNNNCKIPATFFSDYVNMLATKKQQK